MKTTYIPPLQKEWEERKRLIAEGDKLWDEGMKLWDEGDKLWDEGMKLWEESSKLWDEGDKLWNDAVERHYGKDVKVRWRYWHKDNEPTCHVGGDTYA